MLRAINTKGVKLAAMKPERIGGISWAKAWIEALIPKIMSFEPNLGFAFL